MSALVSPSNEVPVKGRRLPPSNLPETFCRVLRLRAVEEAVGIRKTKIYALMKDGAFPAPVKLGNRSVGWLTDEIEAWVRAKASARS